MNPLSSIYGAIASTRNHLYDRGVLRARKLSAPVISVGSISAGGAGKTPFVIMLGELLKQRGIAFDVLSRGYGRSSRGVRIVDPDGSAGEYGDEPILIAQRLRCPVIVGESRYGAGLLAEQNFKSRLHILDDGFQHRPLARDFDIALLTPKDVRDRLLPSGRLRESLSSLLRADAVVLTGSIENTALPAGIENFWQVRRSLSLSDAPFNPVVFCGIARPDDFLAQIKAKGVVPAVLKVFRDHHSYSADEVRGLLTLRNEKRSGGFITTEKDAINLGPALSQLGQVTVAKAVMELVEPPDALDTMLATIAERRHEA